MTTLSVGTRRATLTIAASMALSLISCEPDRVLDSTPSPYALYSAVLDTLQAEGRWYGPLLLDPRTYSLAGRDSAMMALPGPEHLVVRDRAATAWHAANRRSVTLVDSFTVSQPVVLLTAADQRDRDQGPAILDRLRQRHGEGAVIVRFSLPGVDWVEGEAVLYYVFDCGWMCAEGHHVALRWSGARWTIVADVMTWIH